MNAANTCDTASRSSFRTWTVLTAFFALFVSACAAGSGGAGPRDTGADACSANVLTDRNNCGTCGNVCPANLTCVNGTCGTASCQGGCTNGNTCGANGVCACGTSGTACTGTSLCCNGQCIDPNSNRDNCGGCPASTDPMVPRGVVCQPSFACAQGACTQLTCAPACGSNEFCNSAVPANRCQCGSGTAARDCNETIGETCCGATDGTGRTCVDTTSDRLNCGACGVRLPTNQECCPTTDENTGATRGVALDVSSNIDNCGGCNIKCKAAPVTITAFGIPMTGTRASTCIGGGCKCGSASVYGDACGFGEVCVAAVNSQATAAIQLYNTINPSRPINIDSCCGPSGCNPAPRSPRLDAGTGDAGAN